jgi:hypothetical protein
VPSVSIKTAKHEEISAGSILTCTKRYTEEEVREFCALTGKPAEPLPGYLPCLLVVGPLTKLAGELNYLSRYMDCAMARPVRCDEVLVAELEVTRLDPADRIVVKVEFKARVRCGDEVVASGRSNGFLLRDQPDAPS